MSNTTINFMGKYPMQEWHFPASKGEETWIVGLWSNYKFTCSCPSYVYRENSCKHVKDKRAELEDLYGSIYNYVQMLKAKV